jgi:hypothetical protein
MTPAPMAVVTTKSRRTPIAEPYSIDIMIRNKLACLARTDEKGLISNHNHTQLPAIINIDLRDLHLSPPLIEMDAS